MILFPAIDLKDGQCVRLEQGDMARVTVFNNDPGEQAAAFALQFCTICNQGAYRRGSNCALVAQSFDPTSHSRSLAAPLRPSE